MCIDTSVRSFPNRVYSSAFLGAVAVVVAVAIIASSLTLANRDWGYVVVRITSFSVGICGLAF